MKQKLDYYLVKRFPDFFKGRFDKENEKITHWGFDCNDGWFQIIFQACALIETHINSIKKNNDFREKMKLKIIQGEQVHEHWKKEYEENGLELHEVPTFVAKQVKEKFGTLRFYYENGDQYISGVIASAESISERTCEVCGDVGKLRSGGWIRTLCDKHTPEEKKSIQKDNIKVGDIIEVLIRGANKNIVIKEMQEDSMIGKEITKQYDEEKEKYASIESKESYSITKIDAEVFMYYDGIEITEK